jgi:copper oxidase (laccase) domain-containing protein
VTDAGGGKSTVDLKHVLRAQWAALGGVVGNVHDTPVCTRCDRRYYSYRRDPDAGRALALIGLV